ncbi:MAG: hypothetical protein ACXACP_10245 [Candidatus Hodarchaeales archaeon]|jgi:hypothetical protein
MNNIILMSDTIDHGIRTISPSPLIEATRIFVVLFDSSIVFFGLVFAGRYAFNLKK